MKLTFIQLPLFSSRWDRLGLNDEATRQLEDQIMQNPSAAPLVRGTGGARKMRFAPARWHAGKSGSVRVLYAHFPQHELVLLITAYGKSEQGNITAADASAIKAVFDRIAIEPRGER